MIVSKTLRPYTLRHRKVFASNGTLQSELKKYYPSEISSGYAPGYRYHSRDSYRIPNYKSLLKSQGWLPVNSYWVSRTGVDGSSYQRVYRSGNGQERVEILSGYLNVPQYYTNYETFNAGTEAQITRDALLLDVKDRVLSKARDMRINIPVALAEGRKTVKMLTDTASTLYRSYRAFRKGRFKKAAEELGIDTPVRSLANHWLAYKYGWKPLIADAVGAATFMYDYMEGRPPKTTLRSRVTTRTKKSGSYYYQADPLVTGCQNWVSWERTMSASAGLLVRPEWRAAHTSAQLGMGWEFPLLTAWELVPFSFVFDWFVDVGGWLEARSSLQGFNVLTGWAAWGVSYQGTTTQELGTTFYKLVDGPKPVWNHKSSYYSRSLWTGSLGSVSVSITDALNAAKLTTLASLAVQQLSGDRKKGAYRP